MTSFFVIQFPHSYIIFTKYYTCLDQICRTTENKCLSATRNLKSWANIWICSGKPFQQVCIAYKLSSAVWKDSEPKSSIFHIEYLFFTFILNMWCNFSVILTIQYLHIDLLLYFSNCLIYRNQRSIQSANVLLLYTVKWSVSVFHRI